MKLDLERDTILNNDNYENESIEGYESESINDQQFDPRTSPSPPNRQFLQGPQERPGRSFPQDSWEQPGRSFPQDPWEQPGRPFPPDSRERPGRPFPQDPREQPGRPFPPGTPDMQAPMSPPPNMTPRLPRGVIIPTQGTQEFNIQYGDYNRRQNRLRRFRFCLNRFTHIWLWNGSSFWFYPTSIRRNSVEGFIWSRGRWYFYRINLNSIFYFSCF